MHSEASDYKCKVYLLYTFLLIDVIINAVVDASDSVGMVIALAAVQLVLRLVDFFMFFLVMSGTFVFRYGLLGELFKRFRLLLITAPLSFAVTLAFRVWRVSLALNDSALLSTWNAGFFNALFIIHGFACVLFYVCSAHSCQQLGRATLYKPSAWLN